MAAGDLITEDFEVEYNGVLLGGDSGIEIVSFAPFENPDVRSSDLERPLDHGLFPGTDYYGGRAIPMQLEVWNGWTGVRAVLEAFQTTDEQAFVFQLPTIGKLQMNARVRRRSPLPIDISYAVGEMTQVAVEMFATDPRVYSSTISTATATLAAAASGLTFNATFNAVFGAGSSSSVSVTNNGTFETRPLIRINGPIDNPFLENQTSDRILLFNGSLADGEYLDVDFLNHTVLLNGTASRYVWVDDSTGWWNLPPGTSSVRLGGSPGSPVPTADIQWRDAYV